MAYSPNPTVEQYTHALFDPSFFLFPIPHPLSLPLHFRGVGCPPPFIYSPRNRTTTTHTRYKAHQSYTRNVGTFKKSRYSKCSNNFSTHFRQGYPLKTT